MLLVLTDRQTHTPLYIDNININYISVTATTSVGDLLTDATSAVRSVQGTLRQLVASPNIAAAANNILATSDNSCGISSVDAGVQSIQRAIGTLDRIVGASGLSSRLDQAGLNTLPYFVLKMPTFPSIII